MMQTLVKDAGSDDDDTHTRWSLSEVALRHGLGVVVTRPTTPCSTKELYLFEESCVWKPDATQNEVVRCPA